MSDEARRDLLKWIQVNLTGTSRVATAGPVLRADLGERYGSASTHFGMVLHDQLVEPGQLQALGEMISMVAGPASLAGAAFKTLLKEVPAFLEPDLFATPNGMYDVPQILATAYFARTADASFKAGVGSQYHTFLNRMQWLLVKVQSAYCHGTLSEFDGLIDTGVSNDFTLESRIAERLHASGRDLMPTATSVIAAVAPGVPTAERAYPLGNTNFINFVKGIDSALWESGRSFVQPATATRQARYLVHMRLFMSDTAERLALGVMPCDRMPIVAPWYASIVLGARAYAVAVAHVATLDSNKPLENTVDFTTFSLMAMAAGGDTGVPSPEETLFNSRSKSMNARTEAQDGPWWALLRATLSGVPLADATAVAKRLSDLPEGVSGAAQTAAMLCTLMHTQTGMAIVGYKVSGKKGIDAYPIAKKLVTARDPMCGQNAIDVVMATYSGTADLERLASDDLAFTGIERQQEAWTRELTLRCPEGTFDDPFEPVEPMLHDAVAREFCHALREVGMAWTRDPVAHELDMRTLERVSTSQASSHCSAWLGVAFDFSKALEGYSQDTLAQPPLIRSPIDYTSANALGTRISARDDEAYMRAHFRMHTEHAIHNARRGGLWMPGNHLVIATWLSTAPYPSATAPGIHVFARVMTEHTLPSADGRLFDAGWREAVERRGDDSVVDAALEFERTLHARNVAAELGITPDSDGFDDNDSTIAASVPIMPALPPHSAVRARVAAIASGPRRFDPDVVPALDAQTTVALERVRAAMRSPVESERVLVSATPFTHGASVAVIALPYTEDGEEFGGHPARQGRLVAQRWPGKADLMRRLALFGAHE